MEFNYDLVEDSSEQKIRRIRLMQFFLGVSTTFMGISYLYRYLIIQEKFLSNLMIGLLCLLGGISLIMTYFQIFTKNKIKTGDVYYRVENNELQYKLGNKSPEEKINLREINSIILGSTEIILKKKNREELFLKVVILDKKRKSEFINILRNKIKNN